MKDFITHCLTGKDNTTFDLFRVLACMGVIEGLGLVIYTVVFKAQPFSLMEFGSGLGVVLVAAATALKVKSTEEPPPKD